MVLVALKMKQNKQNVQKLFRQCGCCAIEGEHIRGERKTNKQTKSLANILSVEVGNALQEIKGKIKDKVSRHCASKVHCTQVDARAMEMCKMCKEYKFTKCANYTKCACALYTYLLCTQGRADTQRAAFGGKLFVSVNFEMCLSKFFI